MNTSRTVLIIDDEKGYRDFYKFALEPLGYRVSSACDGEEGLRMATENDYDIILLDVHMPKMRGPEVLSGIIKVKPKQIVIIFSSSSDPTFSFESKSKETGAFDCLYKPVDLDDMIRLMDRAMLSSGGKK